MLESGISFKLEGRGVEEGIPTPGQQSPRAFQPHSDSRPPGALDPTELEDNAVLRSHLASAQLGRQGAALTLWGDFRRPGAALSL